MSIITRRQIAGLLQTIASSHFQINTFGWGDVPELLGRQNTIYPFMMVTPESPVMGEGEVTHPFRISIADRLQKGLENIEEVDSDMYQVLRDVITQIDNVAYQDMRVELPLTIDPFRAEDAQDVYGFSGVVNIIVDENYDQCAIPSDDVPFDPNPPTQICLPALIENSDSSYVVNVASGGSLILPDVDILVVDINDNPLDTSTIPSVKNHIIDVVCNGGTVENSDSSYSDTVLSGGTLTLPDITVTDSDGSTFSQPSVTNVTCTPSPDADVENSDASYSVQVAAGATLTLPDQDIEVNGVLEGDIPSVGTIEIEVNDEDGNPLAPDNVTITGRKVEIDVNTLDYDKTAFVMLVNTGILGETNDNQFKLNFGTTGSNTYDVKTSDGQTLTNQTGVVTLTFPSVGNYLIEVKGNITVNYSGSGTGITADRNKILQVVNWGTSTLTYPRFSGLNTQVVAKDAPVFATTNQFLAQFNARIPIGEAINTWNVPLIGVTGFNSMFNNNTAFNQALNSWNTVNILSFESMFLGATSFNSAIGAWNTGNVTNMLSMFRGATRFNQAIGTWNTGEVTTMARMFEDATAFNQNIGAWNVSKVTNFSGGPNFGMFRDATAFNNGGSSDINNWTLNSTQAIDMNSMFRGATAFNQNISSWNTAQVTTMIQMFQGATAFNQDISSWNVSNVTTFGTGATTGMFNSATAFNQNLGAWQLRTAGTSLAGIFAGSGMNTANYTDTIVGWANYVFANSGTPANVTMTFQTGRTFTNSRSGGANFVDAQAARAYLVSVGWTISGDTVV
jgi:surface protein